VRKTLFRNLRVIVLLIISSHLAFATHPPFITTFQTSTGGAPYSVAAADFNKDGKIDVVIAEFNDLEVFLGNGDGTFGSPQSLGQPADEVQVGDFNDDGNMDIVFFSFIYQRGGICLGNGNGTFRFNGFFSVGRNAISLIATDLNGDGKLDLIVPNYDDRTVSLVFGNGQGGFSSPIQYTVGYRPWAITTGDFNNDGVVDFAVANLGGLFGGSGPGSVMVFLGIGGGVFQRGITIPSNNYPWSIASGDFNGDGKADLAVTEDTSSFTTAYVQIYLGRGDGTFAHSASYFEPGFYEQVVAADVDQDGRQDLAVLDSFYSSSAIFHGNGDGTFASPTEYFAGHSPNNLILADTNGNGRPDLIIGNFGLFPVDPPSIGVQLSNSNGTYQAAAVYPSAGLVIGYATGDLNSDGNLDLITAGFNGLTIFLGKGDGTFKQPIVYPVGELSAAATGDFNNDGVLDLATVPNGGGPVAIYAGNGDGSLRFLDNCDCGGQGSAIAVADYNGDGNLDLAVTNPSANTITINFGDGHGHFSLGEVIPVGLFPVLAAPGEIIHKGGNDTHKGGNDLVVVNCGSNPNDGECPPNPDGSVSVLLNQGNGTFIQSSNLSPTQTPVSVAAGDFNRDGNTDLAVIYIVTGISSLYLFLGNGDGTFQPPVQLEVDTTASTVLATDFNGDGKLDIIIIGEMISVLLGNGDGTFQPPVEVAGGGGFFGAGTVGDFNNDGAPDVASGPTPAVFVNSAGTKISFKASPNPAAPNTAVQLTARISPGYRGVGIPLPTGTVRFVDLSTFPITTLATARLKSGIAVAAVTTLGLGEHVIQPVYSGDANFNPHKGLQLVETITVGASGREGSSTGTAGSSDTRAGCNSAAPERSSAVGTATKELETLGMGGFAPNTTPRLDVDLPANDETKPRSDVRGKAGFANSDAPVTLQDLLPLFSQETTPIQQAGELAGFDGASARDTLIGGHTSDIEPPDQALGVSATQVIEAVNSVIMLYETRGELLLGPTPLNRFFDLPPAIRRGIHDVYGPFVSDPRVLFDADIQRWFVTAIEIDTDPNSGNLLPNANILIAISTSPDARAPFHTFRVNITDTGFGACPCLGDRPAMATNSDGLFISMNQYSFVDNTFQTALLLALDKHSLAAGVSRPVIGFQDLNAVSKGAFSLQPAQAQPGDATASKGVQYFLSSQDLIDFPDNSIPSGAANKITVWALTNTRSLSTVRPYLTLQAVTIQSEPYAQPPPATQEMGPTPLRDLLLNRGDQEPFEQLDGDDDRIEQVALSKGRLFGVLSTSILSKNDHIRSGVAWFTVQPKVRQCRLTAKIINQGYLAVKSGNLLYPSIAVNKNGQGVLVVSVTGRGEFPSVGYADIENGRVNNAISIAASGAAPEDGFSGYLIYGGNGAARWGDYSAATVDPACQLWFAAEYVPRSERTPLADWGTFIATLPASRCDKRRPFGEAKYFRNQVPHTSAQPLALQGGRSSDQRK